MLDQQRTALGDREPGHGLAQRAAVVQEALPDPAGRPRDHVFAVDQVDHRALRPVSAWARSTITCITCSRSPDAAAEMSRCVAMIRSSLLAFSSSSSVGELGLGDVLDHRDRDLRGLGGAGVAPNRDPDPDHVVVPADVTLLVLVGAALLVEQLLEEALGHVDVVGMGERGEAHAHELSGGRSRAFRSIAGLASTARPSAPTLMMPTEAALEQHAEALVGPGVAGSGGRRRID